jgi:outer membrane receptor protein involved in Fe transport
MRKSTFFTCLILTGLLLSVSIVSAQNAQIRGKIVDENTGDPLPFVNIGIMDTSVGTFTNEDGIFHFDLPPGHYTLVITSVGYDRMERSVDLELKKPVTLDLYMKATAQELSTVVVSASKYAQRLQESISSIEVLKPSLIENKNMQSIDQALNMVPGVTVMNDEPQIRAGSGFASGLGSRVMVMVDEIPLMRGDAGRPVWNIMPVHDIEQIEVIKGAASVIYGSSALSGAINVRTAWPKEEKHATKVTMFSSMYSRANDNYKTPWTGLNPMQFGLTISHMQKFENVDLGGSITYFNDQGYLGKTPEWADTVGSTTGAYERYIKLNFNSRVRSKKYDGLSYGLNGTVMTGKSATTYFWFDSDTNIYRPYSGSISNFTDVTMYFDPFVKYFSDKGGVHSFRNRFFYNNGNASNNQSNMSFTVYDEYQYQKKFKALGDLVVTGGIMNTYSYSYGQVFSGKLSADSTTTGGAYGTYTSDNFAVYVQLEKKFFHRLTVLVGGRFEYFMLGDLRDSKPVFRAGVNFQASKNTFLRASVGQGYRFPSIGERYITTNSGNFGFYPNPDLMPENSLNTEIGIKQMFHVGKFGGYADLAGFYELYDNYVEFNFGIWGRSPEYDKNLGFKFFNTGPARIYGLDFNSMAQGLVTRTLSLSFMVGYTYAVPQSTDPHYVFYSDKKMDYTYINTSSDTTDNILKYRIQHVVKADVELTRKRWSGGVTGRYCSYIRNIDKFFYDLEAWPPGDPAFDIGIVKYREKHHSGNFIVDLRVSYTIRSFRFSAIVNNILNTEYSLRPATIEPTRLTSLQVIYKI